MKNDFEDKLENLTTPNADFVKHQEVLKIGMLNARKSARIGLIFILTPLLLIVLVYLKMKLLIQWDFFTKLQQFVTNQNQTLSMSWVSHILFLGLPILAILLNLLAITHFYVDKQKKELIITIRYRLKNLIVLLVSAVLLVIVFIYVLL